MIQFGEHIFQLAWFTHQLEGLIEILLRGYLTTIPENGWLEYYISFLFGPRPIFRCELLVSGRVITGVSMEGIVTS